MSFTVSSLLFFIVSSLLLSSQDAARALENPLKDLQLDQFKVIRELSSSNFRSTFLVEHVNPPFNKLVLKKFGWPCQCAANARRPSIAMEVMALRILSGHPFIIQMYALITSRYANYLVMEPCSRDLNFIVNDQQYSRFSEKTVQFYAASLIIAIRHMHSRGIIHRDLKLMNMVLDKQGFLKIVDFGTAKFCTDATIVRIGTWRYWAPEMSAGKAHGEGVDWWALGHVLYELLTRRHINVHSSAPITHRSQLKFPSHLSEAAVDLLSRLLEIDPSKRLGVVPGSADIFVRHPFFEGVDWIALEERRVTSVPIIEPIG